MFETGLFDWHERFKKIDKNGDPLVRLNKVINWDMFRQQLEIIRQKKRKSNAGAKAYDVVLMFKILILQSLYNLSDDSTEYQIMDRLSFMRFLGLGLGDKIPDSKTIWLFREQQGNRTRSKIRSRVEHIFGVQAQTAGNLILWCIGLIRAEVKIGLRNFAFNMMRYKTLLA